MYYFVSIISTDKRQCLVLFAILLNWQKRNYKIYPVKKTLFIISFEMSFNCKERRKHFEVFRIPQYSKTAEGLNLNGSQVQTE